MSEFKGRHEVVIGRDISPSPSADGTALAERVIASLSQYEGSDIWISEVKFSIFGREFELWITGADERPSDEYIERLAGTLSVVNELKPLMEQPLMEFYEENKRVFGQMFGDDLFPDIPDPTELWSAMNFGILGFDPEREEIAANIEGREFKSPGGMIFSLQGDQPWNAEDGVVVSVRGGKIVVTSDASLVW